MQARDAVSGPATGSTSNIAEIFVIAAVNMLFIRRFSFWAGKLLLATKFEESTKMRIGWREEPVKRRLRGVKHIQISIFQ